MADRVYHVTSEAAESILRDGFSDDMATFADSPGVWVSAPMFELASLPALKGARLLAVDVDPAGLADYEVQVIDGPAVPDLPPGVVAYRERIVPAAVLNRWPSSTSAKRDQATGDDT